MTLGKLVFPWIKSNSAQGGEGIIGFATLFLLLALTTTSVTLGALWFSSTRRLRALFGAMAAWLLLAFATGLQILLMSGDGGVLEFVGFLAACNGLAALMVIMPVAVLHRTGRRVQAGQKQ